MSQYCASKLSWVVDIVQCIDKEYLRVYLAIYNLQPPNAVVCFYYNYYIIIQLYQLLKLVVHLMCFHWHLCFGVFVIPLPPLCYPRHWDLARLVHLLTLPVPIRGHCSQALDIWSQPLIFESKE
ncbi:hypothetical protein F5Y07DRAFT_335672 [Xylaria sp. FL0933]|nr:hypothetical protein F5Y07DRAFT_335672 [Xylaria sp. FL0933]